MLKKIFTATLLFISLSTYAYPRYGSSCPKFYLGLSTGIDNPSGFIGLNADVPLSSHFSLGAGGGLSLMWGYKAYAEGRFFFRECNRGFAFGAGATYNSGIKNVTIDANTNIGNAPVTMTLDPVITAMASGYYFFSLGERHRFHLQLGYSQRFEEHPYYVHYPFDLTSDGKTAMDVFAPGGLIFGFGFTFGIGGR